VGGRQRRFSLSTDRATFTIISERRHIYPQECENLRSPIPRSRTPPCSAFPNADSGEEVKAVVRRCRGFCRGRIWRKKLMLFLQPIRCRARGAALDRLRGRVAAASTGKLYKRLLRDRLLGDKTSRIL